LKDYDDYRRLLDDKSVEGVFIATPHYLHGPMAIDAIQAGKHVYCEKAMAYTIGENQDIYNLVLDRPNLVFQVGHQRHYSPLYQEVLRRIDDDQIGDVAAIRAQWNKNDVLERTCPDPALEKIINWRLYSEYSGGLTTEFASHQIDVANWAFHTHPDSVCGYGGVDWSPEQVSRGRDTTDNIHLIFNYKVPVWARDSYGWLKKADGKRVQEVGPDGKPLFRDVRFTYTSIMQNAHIGPSELIMGRYGTLEVSLLGGESFEEKQQRKSPEEGGPVLPAVKAAASKVQLGEGGLPRRTGKVIEVVKDPQNAWVEFTEPIAGAYDREETLLAVGSFIDCIRKSREKKPFKDNVKADVTVGLWGSVPALMANIAMRENRTVYWKEFFPDDVA
jgi:predicted dehydrogenase